MATPAPKSPVIESMLEQQSQELYGRSRKASIENDVCLVCGRKELVFKNELSRKEYTISGMCQKCQDDIFGGPLNCGIS